MTLADRGRLEASQGGEGEPESDARGWYDPDAASYLELLERVVTIQRRRERRMPAANEGEPPRADRS